MQDLRGFPSHNPPLSACEKESSIFPRRDHPRQHSAASREIAASREATTWGSDVELEEDGEWADRPRLFSPEHVRANSPFEFVHDFLFPSPRARDTVSFGLDDILHTAASDSEDFGPALADALPPSGQEARPSAACSELVDVLSRATEKARAGLARWAPRVPSFETPLPLLSGKSYIAAGQAGMALHMMAILQAYQADVLKEMDEGTGLTPEAVKELRRVTDLALRATKHTRLLPTLRVYVAAIAARRELDEIPLGRHRMVSAFMRGVRRLGRFAPRQFFLGTYQSSSKV